MSIEEIWPANPMKGKFIMIKRMANREKAQRENYRFSEATVLATDQALCIDGRDLEGGEVGPKLPGGSLLPVLLKAIEENQPISRVLPDAFATLEEHGFTQGVHVDDHAHGDAGGCGFADQLPTIVAVAKMQKDEITTRLAKIYTSFSKEIGMTKEAFSEMVENAYQPLLTFADENIDKTGKALIELAVANRAKTSKVLGHHGEDLAVINLKEGTTLDTNTTIATEKRQAFDMDAWTIPHFAKALSLEERMAMGQALIFYVATEMVLVEKLGRDLPQEPGVPVFVRGN